MLRSTALVCCLYSDAVHAVPTTTPARSTGADWILLITRTCPLARASCLGVWHKLEASAAGCVDSRILCSPARMGPSRQDKQNSTTTAPDASSTARGPRSLDTLLHVRTAPSSLSSKHMSGSLMMHSGTLHSPLCLPRVSQAAHLNTRLRRLSNSFDINAVSSAGSWRSKKSIRCSSSVRNSSRRNVASTCVSRRLPLRQQSKQRLNPAESGFGLQRAIPKRVCNHLFASGTHVLDVHSCQQRLDDVDGRKHGKECWVPLQ